VISKAAFSSSVHLDLSTLVFSSHETWFSISGKGRKHRFLFKHCWIYKK